jgi:hypothetical protein
VKLNEELIQQINKLYTERAKEQQRVYDQEYRERVHKTCLGECGRNISSRHIKENEQSKVHQTYVLTLQKQTFTVYNIA